MIWNISIGQHHCPFERWDPSMGRIFEQFAYDTETTLIDDKRPDLTPDVVLATACDGTRGVFIPREHVRAFFEAHAGAGIICHNAAFDLAVTQKLIGPEIDLYAGVEEGRIWDTMILKRLLSLATIGNTAQGQCSLAACAKEHLGIDVDKTVTDSGGTVVRQSFDRFLHKPFTSIPAAYLRYAATDPLVTWHVFWELQRQIKAVLQNASQIRGYVDDAWLRRCIAQFGPLTHHVQLKAAIICDVLNKTGIGIDTTRQAAMLESVTKRQEQYAQRLRQAGIPIGEPGVGKAMQEKLNQFHKEHCHVPLYRTPKGDKWSTTAEHMAELADYMPLFADWVDHSRAQKLGSTYLSKMGRKRLHPHFGFLLATGRMCCGGGFNLQNLPRAASLPMDEEDLSIRGCFVPDKGKVFIDADYAQIELVVLAYVLEHQFRYGPSMLNLINEGKDLHRIIAAAVLQKDVADVTKAERNSAKAISFGRPGGMGAAGLQSYAKATYGQQLTLAEVQERINAYNDLCPELVPFLNEELDVGMVVARTLGLTKSEFLQAQGCPFPAFGEDADEPQSWLGQMLLKTLRFPLPCKTQQRPYTPAELNYFWHKAQQLAGELNEEMADALQKRQPSDKLFKAVRNVIGARPVFTVTGRIRANTTFCASRNTAFQGPAADGTLLALWLLWRAGYTLVSAIHDQVVIECPADERVHERKADIERLMIEGMQHIVPGMKVKVEAVVSRSLNKSELDSRYSCGPDAAGSSDIQRSYPCPQNVCLAN